VVFLEGGRPTFGPKAAELTGYFYRNLWDHSYFAQKQPAEQPPPVQAGETARSTATGVNQ
jgi:penicillin-binding protein 2